MQDFSLGSFVLGACIGIIGVVVVHCAMAWLDAKIMAVLNELEQEEQEGKEQAALLNEHARERMRDVDGLIADLQKAFPGRVYTLEVTKTAPPPPAPKDEPALNQSLQMSTDAFLFGAYSPAFKRVEKQDIPRPLIEFVLNGPRKRLLDVYEYDLPGSDKLYFVHSSRQPGHCSNGMIVCVAGIWAGVTTEGTPLESVIEGLILRVHSYGPQSAPPQEVQVPQAMVDFINSIKEEEEQA